MHVQALEFDLIGDIPKTYDQNIRVVEVIQIIECCLQCLDKNTNFNPSKVDPTDQPLLPDVLTIKALCAHKAVKLVEVFHA